MKFDIPNRQDSSSNKDAGSAFKGLGSIIVFENEDFVAINKPAGLLSIPDRTQSAVSLKDMLIEKYGSIFTVHRLDKDTSGIIVFAKHEAAHKFLSQAFEERKVEKYYAEKIKLLENQLATDKLSNHFQLARFVATQELVGAYHYSNLNKYLKHIEILDEKIETEINLFFEQSMSKKNVVIELMYY